MKNMLLIVVAIASLAAFSACEKNELSSYLQVELTVIAAESPSDITAIEKISGDTITLPIYSTESFDALVADLNAASSKGGIDGLGMTPDLGDNKGQLFLSQWHDANGDKQYH